MSRRHIGRFLRPLAASLVVAAASVPAFATAPASAGTCVSWSGMRPPNTSAQSQLNGVAVLSPCNAWAVGTAQAGAASQSFIEHWNGSGWSVVPSPLPGSASSFLQAVRAVSASNIWAVGGYGDGTHVLALILHWNGSAWQKFAAPTPGNGSSLSAIDVASSRDAW